MCLCLAAAPTSFPGPAGLPMVTITRSAWFAPLSTNMTGRPCVVPSGCKLFRNRPPRADVAGRTPRHRHGFRGIGGLDSRLQVSAPELRGDGLGFGNQRRGRPVPKKYLILKELRPRNFALKTTTILHQNH